MDTCRKYLKHSMQSDLFHNLGPQHTFNFPPETLMLLGGVGGSVTHAKWLMAWLPHWDKISAEKVWRITCFDHMEACLQPPVCWQASHLEAAAHILLVAFAVMLAEGSPKIYVVTHCG